MFAKSNYASREKFAIIQGKFVIKGKVAIKGKMGHGKKISKLKENWS